MAFTYKTSIIIFYDIFGCHLNTSLSSLALNSDSASSLSFESSREIEEESSRSSASRPSSSTTTRSSLIVNVKVDPSFYFDSKNISPSRFETIFYDITSPKPIPFVFIWRESFTKPNNLNSFSLSDSLMPMPVSMTEIFSTSELCISTTTSTLPFSVNLSAFDYRFNRTCIIRCLSDEMIGLYCLN